MIDNNDDDGDSTLYFSHSYVSPRFDKDKASDSRGDKCIRLHCLLL